MEANISLHTYLFRKKLFIIRPTEYEPNTLQQQCPANIVQSVIHSKHALHQNNLRMTFLLHISKHQILAGIDSYIQTGRPVVVTERNFYFSGHASVFKDPTIHSCATVAVLYKTCF